MKTRVILDKTGRIVIPRSVRRELRLEPGDALEVKQIEGRIILRPLRGTTPLMQEHGVWVFHSGEPLPASATDEMLELTREERDAVNFGKGKR